MVYVYYVHYNYGKSILFYDKYVQTFRCQIIDYTGLRS